MRWDGILVGVVLALAILLSVGSSSALKRPIRLHARGCGLGVAAVLLGSYLAGQPWALALRGALTIALGVALLYLFGPLHRKG